MVCSLRYFSLSGLTVSVGIGIFGLVLCILGLVASDSRGRENEISDSDGPREEFGVAEGESFMSLLSRETDDMRG